MNTFQHYYRKGYLEAGTVYDYPGTYFVSSIFNGTTTGVLREHAIRMDTHVQCKAVDSFPKDCAGDRPLVTKFSSPALSASVCAEGSFDRNPWNRTRNKQEIAERLWMSMEVDKTKADEYYPISEESDLYYAKNFTMRCDATSTRGWFELGNYQNGYTHQPILETWPSPEVITSEFNDMSDIMGAQYYPIEE